MSWRAITDADIQTRISGAELDRLRVAHLAEGQEDPIPAIATQITNRVRRACKAANNIALGDAGTIPEDLLTESLDLIVREICKRPGYVADDELTKIRMKAADDADAALRRVASGEETIESADPFEIMNAGGIVSEPARTTSSDGALFV